MIDIKIEDLQLFIKEKLKNKESLLFHINKQEELKKLIDILRKYKIGNFPAWQNSNEYLIKEDFKTKYVFLTFEEDEKFFLYKSDNPIEVTIKSNSIKEYNIFKFKIEVYKKKKLKI